MARIYSPEVPEFPMADASGAAVASKLRIAINETFSGGTREPR